MSTIMIRDLSAAKELDRRAMTEVKGGMSPLHPKHSLFPGNLSIVDASKWTHQVQTAAINNTAVGIGGSNVFNQTGAIVQTQSA